MNPIQIRHYDSVSAIHPTEWSRLDVLSGFSSYRWLQTVERFAGRPCALHYVVAYIQEQPVGAIVLELVNDVDRESGIVRRLLGGRRVLRHTFGKYLVPHLVAGTPYGYGGQFLIDANMGITQRSHVVQELLSAAGTLSDSLRAPLWFSDVLARDTELINTLRNAGYLSCQYLPLAELAIEWHTFEEYVDTLKSRYKNNIRREQKRCRAAGVVFEEPTNLDDRDKTFVQLANQTYGKHGDLAFPFNPGFFSSLKSNLGDEFQVCNALESGNILGFVTMISDGQTAWGGNYGLDYTNSSSANVYFNLVLQWPIQKAIELGLKRLVLGRGQYGLKMRRGCTLHETYLFHKPPNALSKPIYSGLFRMLDRHYKNQAGLNN